MRLFYFSIVAMSTLGYGGIVLTKTNMPEPIFVTFVILIGGLAIVDALQVASVLEL